MRHIGVGNHGEDHGDPDPVVGSESGVEGLNPIPVANDVNLALPRVVPCRRGRFGQTNHVEVGLEDDRGRTFTAGRGGNADDRVAAAVRLELEPCVRDRPVADGIGRGRFETGGPGEPGERREVAPHRSRFEVGERVGRGHCASSVGIGIGCYFRPPSASRACLTPELSSIRVPGSQCIAAARRWGRH